jgi:hypothetical protein
MILLIASNKISVKTVTKNKFIRLNINWYEKWNTKLLFFACLFLVSSSYSNKRKMCWRIRQEFPM